MKNAIKFFHYLLVIIFIVITIECNSQSDECIDREPVVAGSFYPENPAQLKTYLESLFAQSEYVKTYDNVLAVIVPHAGYVYSGKVAASGYNQIDPDKEYDNIFIIASSHRVMFNGASVYNLGDYITPLGKVAVNKELADKLIRENEIFVFNQDAHAAEHSLEVQLPFLQYKMNKDFQIVPIVTGTQTLGEIKKLAEVLLPYFNENNLFIVSTDFSHYPDYNNALIADKKTGDAILSNSVVNVINAINWNGSANFENLVTSLCGWPSVLTLLNITEKNPDIQVIHVDYQNSGDVSGDKSRVVGYHSIVFAKKKTQNMSQTKFILSDHEKQNLLEIARTTIVEYLEKGKTPVIDKSLITKAMETKCGAFVTLHKKGELRGCIGRFVADEPLYIIVQKMAVAAATEDSRFTVVKNEEMHDIDLEISVLTPLEKIESVDEIEMGRHGIYIKKGFSSGTFLPQVAIETGWTKEEFLGYCARNKAGIGWEGWKEADIYIYEALIFGEKEIINNK
ncbi:MAG: AmmeMemoRadiSam system protein B [Bacteroidales bacterium]|nr:AmmeMemoRadiSam system protein B [Bacteroidales bacterium]